MDLQVDGGTHFGSQKAQFTRSGEKWKLAVVFERTEAAAPTATATHPLLLVYRACSHISLLTRGMPPPIPGWMMNLFRPALVDRDKETRTVTSKRGIVPPQLVLDRALWKEVGYPDFWSVWARTHWKG